MDIAIIPPLALLDEQWVRHQPMHMILPHLFPSEEYRDYVKNSTGYKLLDNGAAEGDTYNFDALNGMAEAFNIDEVVIPDTIGDCDLTIEQARWACRSRKPQGVKWMAVVQGEEIDQFLKCWRELVRLEYVDVIGVPRHMNKKMPTARYQLLKSIRDHVRSEGFLSKPIHALGSHSWGREVKALAELGVVRSMDTSFPIHMAQHGIDLQFDSEGIPRASDYFEWLPNEEGRIHARDNFLTYTTWATT